jgi:putative acetyltransferase
MTVEIRLATIEELDEIVELQTHSLLHLSAQDYNPEQIEALVHDQANWRGLREAIFVAESDGKIAGFSALSIDYGQITGVYVLPEFTRQGIGTQLLVALEEAALQKKYRHLWVISSLTAISFYKANGYDETRKTGFMTSTDIWIPCARLEKRLGPSPLLETHSPLFTVVILLVLFVISLMIVLIR